ncbi:MAG: PAS domain S-box protein [Acidobacteria bacterium]|nr:MAG: PAS domain S-box protein [Acidobacteriota bacterium]
MKRPESANGQLRPTEEQYRSLVEQSNEVIFVVNVQGCFTYVSPAIERTMGYRPDEIVGKPFSQFVHPDDINGLQASFAETLQGRYAPHQFRVLAKDRRIHHVHTFSRLLRNAGDVTGVMGVMTDITAHTRGEEVRAAIYRISDAVHRTQNLDELFSVIHGIIGELMPADNFYIALYDRAQDLIQFPYFRDELDEAPGPIRPGKSLTGYVQATGEALLITRDRFLELEQSGVVEAMGSPSVDWLGVPLKSQHGDVIGVMAVQTYAEGVRLQESDKEILVFVSRQVVMAIERKRADEQLTREHGLLTTLMNHLPDAVYVKDRDSRFLYANPVLARLMEAGGPDDLVGKTDFDFWPAVLASQYRADETELMRTGKPLADKDETRYDSLGNRLSILTTKVPLRDETGNIIGLVGVSRDMTERLRAEEALRASEAQLESIFKASPTGIALAAGRRLLEVNERFCELTGYSREDLIGQDLRRLYTTDDAYVSTEVELDSGIQHRGWGSVETRWQRKGGEEIDVLLNAAPLESADINNGLTLTVSDISEQKKAEQERDRLEQQLWQLQKMESIGRLAGGVAHDFNNLLTAISGNIQLALMDTEKGRLPVSRLQQALKAAQSASSLTQQLLAFSRKQLIAPRILDLNEILANMREMLARLVGEDVQLLVVAAPTIGRVKVDPAQIEQLVVNLCANARDAMPNGGQLTIETSNVALDERYCLTHAGATPGEYVRLAVSDTGGGLTKEALAHIFEPFFTTKAKGKGTGLGLAMVYGAVKQNGGTIEVYSEAGRGTSFKIYLPSVSGQLDDAPVAMGVEDLVRGSETVLLVEDGEYIREFAEDVLRQAGYEVIPCSTVKTAIDQSRSFVGPIHLLLTDVILPDGNARDLAKTIGAERPQIKVLFTSGYAENVIVHHGVLDPQVQFIGKPFTAAALARKVRETLGPAA